MCGLCYVMTTMVLRLGRHCQIERKAGKRDPGCGTLRGSEVGATGVLQAARGGERRNSETHTARDRSCDGPLIGDERGVIRSPPGRSRQQHQTNTARLLVIPSQRWPRVAASWVNDGGVPAARRNNLASSSLLRSPASASGSARGRQESRRACPHAIGGLSSPGDADNRRTTSPGSPDSTRVPPGQCHNGVVHNGAIHRFDVLHAFYNVNVRTLFECNKDTTQENQPALVTSHQHKNANPNRGWPFCR